MRKNIKCLSLRTWFVVIIIIVLVFFLGIKYDRYYLSNKDKVINSNSSQLSLLDSDLLKKRFLKLAVDNRLLEMWNIRSGTSVNKSFPNRYYYSQSSGPDTIRIGYYDVDKDNITIDSDNNIHIDIADKTNWVYEKYIDKSDYGIEFRIIGFDGNKLVFYTINSDDTPGPCANMWIREGDLKYEYIDITDDSSIPKIYKISDSQRKQYQKEQDQCIKDNS